MLIWISILLFTAVAAWYLAQPLRVKTESENDTSDADLQLFRTQIQEIDEDLAAGTLSPDEAEALRAEVGRRMLSVSRNAAKSSDISRGRSDRGRKIAAITVTAVMPALVFVLYFLQGSPHLPTKPFAARGAERAAAAEQLEYANALERLEKVMQDRPNDPKGWQLLAQGYANFGRYDDAVDAYQKAIDLGNPTAGILAGFGETLTLQNNGVVSPPARDAFSQALDVDPKHIRSRYYLALDKGLRGAPDEATRELEKILDDPNVDDAQAEIIKAVIVRLQRGELTVSQTTPPADRRGPSAEDVMEAQTLDAAARQEMIENMVAGLASRLEDEPSDPEGWVMLVRSLRILGREEEAANAITRARAQFENDPGILSQINSEFKAE